MRISIRILLLFLLIGCSGSTRKDNVNNCNSVCEDYLRTGIQEVVNESTNYCMETDNTVLKLEILSDSRCPCNEICFWQGELVYKINIGADCDYTDSISSDTIHQNNNSFSFNGLTFNVEEEFPNCPTLYPEGSRFLKMTILSIE